MAVHQVRLHRQDSSFSWGFRLFGGADYHTPLGIESVAPGSVSDRCGLQTGDVILAINNRPMDHVRHEEAKMEILRAGNEVVFTIQKGGTSMGTTVWKPQVQQVYPEPQMARGAANHGPKSPTYVQHNSAPAQNHGLYADIPKVSNTSLAANPSGIRPVGNNYNNSPKPFNVGARTITTNASGRTKQVFHNTYNTPTGLYANNYVQQTYESTLAAAQAPDDNSAGFRSVKPPEPGTPRPNLAGASMYCGSCGDMIKGVFVKVQGRVPMHPECLKCAKCGVGRRLPHTTGH